jgi:polyisoprenyl-phosphate glycosyltransferase
MSSSGPPSGPVISSAPVEETSAVVPHRISIVIPVYGGERTLASVVEEIAPLVEGGVTADGHAYIVGETLLVYDNGRDDSPRVIRELEERFPFVRGIWLSRNYGQHAATLAGMASSGGDWIVTLDEDGQHDPAFLPLMLDTAMAQQASVVYAAPSNEPPHGFARNVASRGSKRALTYLTGSPASTQFHSYRLMVGEIGRSVAAYAGAGVYLDIAMGWVADRIVTLPLPMRDEGSDRRSGYNFRTLVSHFWRMVLSSGTRGLRLVSILGVTFGVLGALLALFVIVSKASGAITAPGWASTVLVVLLSTGAVLFSLGIIAEYVGVAVNMAMGKPLYLIVGDPADGPLGRDRTPPPGPAPPA